MAKADKELGESKTPKSTEASQQVNINWDTSKMRSTYANVSNVSTTQEEVTVLFGTNKSWQSGQGELTLEITDRMILSPFTAKRLSLVLNNVIKGYESAYGEIQIGSVEPETGGKK